MKLVQALRHGLRSLFRMLEARNQQTVISGPGESNLPMASKACETKVVMGVGLYMLLGISKKCDPFQEF